MATSQTTEQVPQWVLDLAARANAPEPTLWDDVKSTSRIGFKVGIGVAVAVAVVSVAVAAASYLPNGNAKT